MVSSRFPKRVWWAALAALFLFRLLFGLSREFFFEDETQIYLMGLRYYATGRWPYFGPDVVWTKSEIPGALQALLVGVPLKLAPLPEAPFVLLNLLSFAGVAALAAYICRRVPTLPRWLVWGWLMTLPWTLQFSTHVLNPSYALAPAIAFFIGFFESVPVFRRGVIRPWLGHVLMGAAITWIMQVHMSWPLLLPFAGFAWLSTYRDGPAALAREAAAFVAGAAGPALLIVPTILTYGGSGSGGTLRNLQVHAVNPFVVVATLARLLSFASLEINRWIANDDASRLVFMLRHWWLAPLAVVVGVAGLVQPFWMAVEAVRRSPRWPEWQALRALVLACVLVVYASYWFVIEPPQAHAFYVLSPIAFVFAAYCWTFVDSPRTRVLAGVILTANITYHAGLAIAQVPIRSMYKNRDVIATAIRERQPEMFAHRRPFAPDAGPYVLADPTRPYNPTRDIVVLAPEVHTGFGKYVEWTVRLRFDNPRVAFRDVLYFTTYYDAAGRVLDRRHEFVKAIFQPGESAQLRIVDGFAPNGFVRADFRVAAAEALVPITDVPPRAAN